MSSAGVPAAARARAPAVIDGEGQLQLVVALREPLGVADLGHQVVGKAAFLRAQDPYPHPLLVQSGQAPVDDPVRQGAHQEPHLARRA
jgi:hypothetical protein